MKKQITIILVITLLLFLFSSIILKNRQNNLCHYYKNRVVILQDHIEEAIHLNNLKVDFLSGIISTSYVSLNSKELYRGSLRYLLLVSRAGCCSCINEQISIVESYNRQFSCNIGIVFSNETVRGLQQYKRTNKITSNLFVTQYPEELEVAVRHSPVLFNLEEDGRITRAFQPLAEFPELTEKFLDLCIH